MNCDSQIIGIVYASVIEKYNKIGGNIFSTSHWLKINLEWLTSLGGIYVDQDKTILLFFKKDIELSIIMIILFMSHEKRGKQKAFASIDTSLLAWSQIGSLVYFLQK